jgi:hypothetical protein
VRFWDVLSDLSYEDKDGDRVEITFPFASLDHAVTPCASTVREESRRWERLLQQIEAHRTCCGDAEVKMKRYWGW